MINIRRSHDRGHFNHGWLETYHTFSFGDYHDPRHQSFSVLRVINEDFVQPGEGFPTHAHRDMEIITYVLEGALEHKDSLGTTSVIRAGDVQRMSAGSGVTHSEYNHSQNERVHLLQIWILPKQKGLAPGYEQKTFGDTGLMNRLRLIASSDGRQGSVSLGQDLLLYDGRLEAGLAVTYNLPESGRKIWLQIIRGTVDLGREIKLQAGDGAAIENEESLLLSSTSGADFLLFDLPQ